MAAATACFITATDTDSGKTFVTTLLLDRLRRRGTGVVALKPVACGVGDDGVNGDVARLRALQPGQTEINLHTTPKPLAPLFDQPVDRAALLAWCRRRMAAQPVTLIEGVGGLMVPLAAGFTQLDWIAALPEAMVVLVVRARLGCLSQMLAHLTLLAPRRRVWLVINAVSEAEMPFADQCRQAARAWFPRVKVALVAPGGGELSPLVAWLLAPERTTSQEVGIAAMDGRANQ